MKTSFNEDGGLGPAGSIGPFKRFPAVVNGWTVPSIDVYTYSERPGLVTFVCDHRFAIDVPDDLAQHFLSWLSQVVAVSQGWTCHPPSHEWDPPEFLARGPSRKLPWRRMTAAGGQSAEEARDG